MASEFSNSVGYGLRLVKRTYHHDKGAPPAPQKMSKSASETYLPTAVMAYAVLVEPAALYTPNVPAFQQSVAGRFDQPALIPLQMNEVCMEVDCCMDTAFVTVTVEWIVHCVRAQKSCDCRIAVPMGEQGSLLDVKVDIPGPGAGKSYNSKWVEVGETKKTGKVPKAGDGGRFLKPHLYTFNIPQVEGKSRLSIKVSWSQKLLYQEGRFCLSVPFSFPACVSPVEKTDSKREKIVLNVNSGTGTEILGQPTSHPLKELSGEVRKLGFTYEAEVEAWSAEDFKFSYTVSSSEMIGGVLLQSPQLNDLNAREMLCFYLFPGNEQTRKVFRKEVVFIVDNSESMKGAPLESVKTAVSKSLSKLNPEDSFNLISFNSQTRLFSSKMEQATDKSISNATQWLKNLTAGAGTNILIPIQEAIKLLADASGSIPLIFLITGGTVKDERGICNMMKDYMTSRGSISPRICTFGVGPNCNHYFLQMLAQIGRGHYDCAYDADSIASRIERLFTKTSSIILADITIDMPEHKDVLELFPSHVPDLSFENPLIVFGTYKGAFPDNIKVSGILADMTNFETDLKVKNANDVLPLDRVFARRQIDSLTAQAWWFPGNEELKEKVTEISLQTSFPSEYTGIVLFQTDSKKKAPESDLQPETLSKINKLLTKGDTSKQSVIFLGFLGVGFGNLSAAPQDAEIFVKPDRQQMAEDVVVGGINWVGNKITDPDQHCGCFQHICSYLSCFDFFNCCNCLDCFHRFDCFNCSEYFHYCFRLCG